MLSSIPCGDLELNIGHPHGTPTLVPSTGLEARLDLRLDPQWQQTGNQTSPQRLAVHLHVHYLDTLAPLLEALHRCREGLADYDLWVSTDSSAKASAIRSSIEGEVQVRVCSNRGRNLGPLLSSLWPELKAYDLLLHLHGKRSVESDLGVSWRQELLTTLLPDSATVQQLRQSFQRDDSLGLVMPQPPELIRPYLNWGMNFEMAALLAERLKRPLQRSAVLLFPAGTMFWCRPAALAPLTGLCQELPPEPLAVDGTSLHALERLVVHSCEQAQLRWRLLCSQAPALASSEPATLSVWDAQPADYLQATAAMAARLRQEYEQRTCAETNLARCQEQLEQHIAEASESLTAADQQIRALMQQVAERDEHLHAIRRSLSWKLTRPLRWLKALVPAGT